MKNVLIALLLGFSLYMAHSQTFHNDNRTVEVNGVNSISFDGGKTQLRGDVKVAFYRWHDGHREQVWPTGMVNPSDDVAQIEFHDEY